MPPKKRPVPLPSQGTLVGWAKKRQTIAETVIAEAIMKTDNEPEGADTGDIGDVVGNIDNRSIAIDKTQPVFVKSFQTRWLKVTLACSGRKSKTDTIVNHESHFVQR